MRLLWAIPFLALSAFGTIIPSSNRVDWVKGSTVGVPGGIPTRTTIFTNLYSTNTTHAVLNAAIAACPSNQVVYLNAGTYAITGQVTFGAKQYITVRGAGMGQTILDVSNVASNSTTPIVNTEAAHATAVAITNGFTKGGSNIVVASTTSLSVGDILSINQQNDWFVFRQEAISSSSNAAFRVIVQNISGSTVTVWPPLLWDLKAELAPHYRKQNAASSRFVGIEDLTVNAGADTGAPYIIYFNSAYGCWIKGVEGKWVNTTGFFLNYSLNCEIRECYLHENNSYQDGVAIYLYSGAVYGGTSGCLIENNYVDRCNGAVLMSGASGNAVTYNFNTNSRNTQAEAYVLPSFKGNHGPHGAMNLWEGNVGEGFLVDGYHGSASHQTIFRNWFHCMSTNSVHNRIAINIPRAEYFFNAVGNVLGSWWATNAAVEYEMSGEPQWYNDTGCIYRLGYPNMGNNLLTDGSPVLVGYTNTTFPEYMVTNAFFRHGNYDFKTLEQKWDSGTADHDIPNSLIYDSKPSFFGSLTWPPVSPTNAAALSAVSIPAGYVYVYGTNPPAEPLPPEPSSPTNYVGTMNVGTLIIGP